MMNPREGLYKLFRPVHKLQERRKQKKFEKSLNESNPIVIELATGILKEIKINHTRVPEWLTAIEDRLRSDIENGSANPAPLEFETADGLYIANNKDKAGLNRHRQECNMTFYPRTQDEQIDREDGRTLVVWYQSAWAVSDPSQLARGFYSSQEFHTAHLELQKDKPTPDEENLVPNSPETADAIRRNFPGLFGPLPNEAYQKKEKLTAEQRGEANFNFQNEIFSLMKSSKGVLNEEQKERLDRAFPLDAENGDEPATITYKFSRNGYRFEIESKLVVGFKIFGNGEVASDSESFRPVERKLTIYAFPSSALNGDSTLKDGIHISSRAKYNVSLPVNTSDIHSSITHADGALIGLIGDGENIFDDADTASYEDALYRVAKLLGSNGEGMTHHLDLPPVPVNDAYRPQSDDISNR